MTVVGGGQMFSAIRINQEQDKKLVPRRSRRTHHHRGVKPSKKRRIIKQTLV